MVHTGSVDLAAYIPMPQVGSSLGVKAPVCQIEEGRAVSERLDAAGSMRFHTADLRKGWVKDVRLAVEVASYWTVSCSGAAPQAPRTKAEERAMRRTDFIYGSLIGSYPQPGVCGPLIETCGQGSGDNAPALGPAGLCLPGVTNTQFSWVLVT